MYIVVLRTKQWFKKPLKTIVVLDFYVVSFVGS